MSDEHWHTLERQLNRVMSASAIVCTFLVAAADEAKAQARDGRSAAYMDYANRLLQRHFGPFTAWYQRVPSGATLETARERFCIAIQAFKFSTCRDLLATLGLECKLLDQPMGLLHVLQRQAFGAAGVDGLVCVQHMRDTFDKKFQMLCRRIRNRA